MTAPKKSLGTRFESAEAFFYLIKQLQPAVCNSRWLFSRFTRRNFTFFPTKLVFLEVCCLAAVCGYFGRYTSSAAAVLLIRPGPSATASLPVSGRPLAQRSTQLDDNIYLLRSCCASSEQPPLLPGIDHKALRSASGIHRPLRLLRKEKYCDAEK